MSIPNYKLSINSPYAVVKGFIQGFIQGRNEKFNYFFLKHRHQHSSLGDAFRDYLSLNSHCQVCLPVNMLAPFKQAVEGANESIGIQIEAIELIKLASFRFHFHLYSETSAKNCREIFKKIPAGVKLEKYEPVESYSDNIAHMQDAIYEFAPVASYAFEGGGFVSGEFAGVLELYQNIKSCPIAEDIICSDIKVEVDETSRS